MGFNLSAFAMLAGLFFIWIVVKLLRKDSLYPAYAVLWIFIALFLISIPFLADFYRWVAVKVMGLYGGDHLIYIVIIGFLMMYVLYMTSKICKMSDRISKLISYTAVLDNEIHRLKGREGGPEPEEHPRQ
jgi:hypothetical protein